MPYATHLLVLNSTQMHCRGRQSNHWKNLKPSTYLELSGWGFLFCFLFQPAFHKTFLHSKAERLIADVLVHASVSVPWHVWSQMLLERLCSTFALSYFSRLKGVYLNKLCDTSVERRQVGATYYLFKIQGIRETHYLFFLFAIFNWGNHIQNYQYIS